MIREEQTAVWEERREERRERRANRMQEEVEALSEMLELGGSDADTFNDMMTAENDAIRGFWGQVRSGEISWGQARKATRMRRNETDTQVREFWMRIKWWFTRTGETSRSTVNARKINRRLPTCFVDAKKTGAKLPFLFFMC